MQPVKHSTRGLLAWTLGLLVPLWILSGKGYIQSTDTLYSLETARSLLDHGSLRIEPMRGEIPLPGGGTYSMYGIALPFLMLPLLLLGRALAGLTGLPVDRAEEFFVSFHSLPFAMLLSIFFLATALKLGAGERRAALGLGFLFLGTIAWRYSVHDFSEMAQAALLAGTVYFALRSDPRSSLYSGCFYAALVLLKVVHLSFWPLLFLWYMHRHGLKSKAQLLFQLPVAGALFTLAALNQYRYGAFWETGYGHTYHGLSLANIPVNLVPLLLSLEFGLLVFCPVLPAAVPGLKRLFSAHKGPTLLLLGLSVVGLGINLIWECADGGWAWGPRLMMPVLPLLMLPVCFTPFENRMGRALASLLLVFGFLVQMLGILQRTHEYRVIRERHPAMSEAMPSLLPGTAILALQKAKGAENLYPSEALGLPPGEPLDTRGQESYQGWNLWYLHMASLFGWEALRWMLLPGFLVFGSVLAWVIWLLWQIPSGDPDRAKEGLFHSPGEH